MHYDDYESLEKHFAKSHFLCPYDECKGKCYVAFKSEDELVSHIDMVHRRDRSEKSSVINANALLGFSMDTQQESIKKEEKKKYQKEEKPKLKDEEGADFSFWFSTKY